MRFRFVSLFVALSKYRLQNRIKYLSNHRLGGAFLIVNETHDGYDTRFIKNDTENDNFIKIRSDFVKRGILNNLLDDKINMYNKLILIEKTDIFNK